jgi:hypothetical protein
MFSGFAGVFRASLSRFAGSFAQRCLSRWFALRVSGWMSRDLRVEQKSAGPLVVSMSSTVAPRSPSMSEHSDRHW